MEDHIDLRMRLRQATADLHTALDAGLARLDLGDTGDYRRFLEINAAALFPLERALIDAGVERVAPDWSARSRTDAMKHDLALLGGEAIEAAQPKLAGVEDIVGCLYVLEGSRLGAAHMLRRVDRAEPREIREASHYLRHGLNEKLWASFVDILRSPATLRCDPDRTANAARRTFGTFMTAAETALVEHGRVR